MVVTRSLRAGSSTVYLLHSPSAHEEGMAMIVSGGERGLENGWEHRATSDSVRHLPADNTTPLYWPTGLLPTNVWAYKGPSSGVLHLAEDDLHGLHVCSSMHECQWESPVHSKGRTDPV